MRVPVKQEMPCIVSLSMVTTAANEVFCSAVMPLPYAKEGQIRKPNRAEWRYKMGRTTMPPCDPGICGRKLAWVQRYKWAIYFFVAVAFWNMVGAGLFGFMINPPIALYFMQGLNTTPLHGHAALFGVYGMLGIGLMLVCLRAMEPRAEWKEGWLRFSFWGMNAGLMIMCVGSLHPVGLAQTWASVDQGYWYARSSEFLGTPLMQNLRWLRVPGDTLFTIGALVLVAFVFAGHSGARRSEAAVPDALRVPSGD